jgi:hypothetical protein
MSDSTSKAAAKGIRSTFSGADPAGAEPELNPAQAEEILQGLAGGTMVACWFPVNEFPDMEQRIELRMERQE